MKNARYSMQPRSVKLGSAFTLAKPQRCLLLIALTACGGGEGGDAADARAASDASAAIDAGALGDAGRIDADVDPCEGATNVELGSDYLNYLAVEGTQLLVEEREGLSTDTSASLRRIDLGTLATTDVGAVGPGTGSRMIIDGDVAYRLDSGGTLQKITLATGVALTIEENVNGLTSDSTNVYYTVNATGLGRLVRYRKADGDTLILADSIIALGRAQALGNDVLVGSPSGVSRVPKLGGTPTLIAGTSAPERFVAYGDIVVWAENDDDIVLLEPGKAPRLLASPNAAIALAVGPNRAYWWGGDTFIESIRFDGITPDVAVPDIVNVGQIIVSECYLIYGGVGLNDFQPVLAAEPL